MLWRVESEKCKYFVREPHDAKGNNCDKACRRDKFFSHGNANCKSREVRTMLPAYSAVHPPHWQAAAERSECAPPPQQHRQVRGQVAAVKSLHAAIRVLALFCPHRSLPTVPGNPRRSASAGGPPGSTRSFLNGPAR